MSSRTHVLLMVHKTKKRCTLIQQIYKQNVSKTFLLGVMALLKGEVIFHFSFVQEENPENLNIIVCVG